MSLLLSGTGDISEAAPFPVTAEDPAAPGSGCTVVSTTRPFLPAPGNAACSGGAGFFCMDTQWML